MKSLPGNAQHIGSRSQQQDAFGFSDPENTGWAAHAGLVAIVADGMGGMSHGQAASQIATRAFLRAYEQKSPSESIPVALRRALLTANDEVVARARSEDALTNMGTTLVAVVLQESGYHMISVGDSMAYLLRAGQLYRLNAVHTRAADLTRGVCAGTSTPEEATNDPDRHALTSFLGLDPLAQFDTSVHPSRPIPAQPGDRIVLCSDGLSNALTEPQIASLAGAPPQQAAERLVEQALSRRLPRQDNITVLVLAHGDSRSSPPSLLARPRRVGASGWRQGWLGRLQRSIVQHRLGHNGGAAEGRSMATSLAVSESGQIPGRHYGTV